jgi:hypothetical protein
MAKSSGAEVASVIVAIFALGVAGFSLCLSARGDARLDRQESEQNASHIYLGEPPQYASSKFKTEGKGVWTVVMNASGTQVDDVWVEGEGNTSVTIDGLQRCSMYALPEGFKPVAVHFLDSYGRWRRPVDGPPERNGRTPPARDTANSPWWMDVGGCP